MIGENAIEGDGFGGVVRSPGSSLVLLVLLATILFFVGCGGDDEQAQQPPPAPPPDAKGGAPGGAPGGNTAGGSTVETGAQAETLEDQPFTLNQRQPVPPDFRSAYQRKALIVVGFFKEDPDTSRGIEYPQGIGPDRQVHQTLRNLRDKYPQVEFFFYDITEPGNAESSEELNQGEYGTLAAQLDVGYTPYIAMLAPRGEEYIVENLFQGYVERGVLDQALFDLSSADVGGNSSDTNVSLDRVELTESGGSIEYITLTNRGDQEADFGGFVLQKLDPETGEISDAVESVGINENLTLAPGETASIGRQPGIVDANGREVIGTFVGGEGLTLNPGDQVALLDGGGAVVDTISI